MNIAFVLKISTTKLNAILKWNTHKMCVTATLPYTFYHFENCLMKAERKLGKNGFDHLPVKNVSLSICFLQRYPSISSLAFPVVDVAVPERCLDRYK